MKDNVAPKIAEPRQRRAIATRAGLLETVEAIVIAEGIDAVTTTRVAAESGVAVGTIYRYFADRDAMLLAAYDDHVARLVEKCRHALQVLHEDTRPEEAASHILDVYLAGAQAMPAHAGLLNAMRQLRPIAADRPYDGDRILAELFVPFFSRFERTANASPLRFKMMNALLGALVDFYLISPEPEVQAIVREEIEAHLMLMISRISED
ncbi:TetR/AcrR family transcriptional regulator [Mesorhizobium sp. CAU 1741]|uniref:TetR/AcrR family transcriptional regulator n=1 Tax=Mesorhizobium sp. CAU 1741 TaxID=3140366 RepID=UPI00325AE9BF